MSDRDGSERIDHAPRAYLLAVSPTDIARQVAQCDPLPHANTVRVAVSARVGGGWSVDVVGRDRPGLLARETGVLAEHRLDVVAAIAATWGDGCALASFDVKGSVAPDAERLQADLVAALDRPITSTPVADVVLDFDDSGSPWHTLATARAVDRPGLLHALTTAFAAAGANVHAARVHTDGGRVIDVFEMTDVRGPKLRPDSYARVQALLAEGVVERKRRLWRPSLGSGARRRLRIAPSSV